MTLHKSALRLRGSFTIIASPHFMRGYTGTPRALKSTPSFDGVLYHICGYTSLKLTSIRLSFERVLYHVADAGDGEKKLKSAPRMRGCYTWLVGLHGAHMLKSTHQMMARVFRFTLLYHYRNDITIHN